MQVPRLVSDVMIGGLWTASAVLVAGYTWESVKSTWSQLPGPGGGGQAGLNQTGPGQANDPAKVPASPPTSAKQQYRDKTGKVLPYPPNSVLLAGQSQTISWLVRAGWSHAQIRSYFHSLLLNLPPGF